MADLKISQLTGATTPLAGTEVVPLVQSGATRKVAVSDLTAGRAISATQLTLTTDNLIIGTAGKGIDFSANPHSAGMTSELLNDYEEGTWTPSYGGASSDPTCTYDVQFGFYTKVGRFVSCTVLLRTNASSNGSGLLLIKGLPFTSANIGASLDGASGSGSIYVSTQFATNFPQQIGVNPNSTFAYLTYKTGNTASAYVNVTDLANTNPGNTFRATFSYIV